MVDFETPMVQHENRNLAREQKDNRYGFAQPCHYTMPLRHRPSMMALDYIPE
jgi:hypothetical protein